MADRRRRKRKPVPAEAEAGRLSFLTGAARMLEIEAAADKGPRKRRFEIVAYTGEPLTAQGIYGWDAPVVIDLQGIEAADVLPILEDHRQLRDCVVGQSEENEVEDGQFLLRGVMFQSTEAGSKTIALADEGFAWQASVGASSKEKEFFGEGEKVTVNGRSYDGPVWVSRKTLVREVSFVVLGDDKETSIVVARGKKMKQTFGEFCKSAGFDSETMSAAQTKSMQGFYAKQCKGEGDDGDEDDDVEGKRTKAKKTEGEEEPDRDEDEDDNDDEDTEEVDEDDVDEEDKDGKNAKKGGKNKAKASAKMTIKGGDGANNAGTIKNYRKQLASEEQRISRIRAICAKEAGLTINAGGNEKDLCAYAILKGWSAQETKREFDRAKELKELRAARQDPPLPGGLGFSISTPHVTRQVLEAAILQAGRNDLVDNPDSFFADQRGPKDAPRNYISPRLETYARRQIQPYTAEVMDAAHKHFKGRISLQDALITAARSNGYRGAAVIRDDASLVELLQAVDWTLQPGTIKAESASNVSIPNLLANVQNKYLLMGYLFVESAWRDVGGIKPVKDFKPTRSINLFGDFMYKLVGLDGMIQNAVAGDQAFANQAYTYARMMTLTRQYIINDDLGGLTTVPLLLGRGAALQINNLFWTVFLAPGNDDGGVTAFYAASHTFSNTTPTNSFTPSQSAVAQQGNANYASGAGTPLASSSLQTAEILFNKQVDPMGQPLGVNPQILLYPPDIDVQARELMNAQYLVYGGSTASKQPNTNIWYGKFKPVMSRYLSNPTYSGYSLTGWYLLCAPGVIPVIEACFLNGQETPTVQIAQADMRTLGIDMRGFVDFGVISQNFRGGVKMAGA